MRYWISLLVAFFLIPVATSAQEIVSIEMIANGNGPIISGPYGFVHTTPPDGSLSYTADWYRDVLYGNNTILGLDGGMQVGGGYFFVVAGGPDINDFDSARGSWTRNGSRAPRIAQNIYEIRFTSGGGYAQFFDNPTLIKVPFELWYMGPDSTDILDDVRMLPLVYDDNENGVFDFKLDHQASGRDDDPYSDWIYFYMPFDVSARSSGYDAWKDAWQSGEYFNVWTVAEEHIARVVLMNWNQRQLGGGENEMPEEGTIFRINGGDEPPRCDVHTAVFGPPYHTNVFVFDSIGLRSIRSISTTDATVNVSPFSNGDTAVSVEVSQISGDVVAGVAAVLEVIDTFGNEVLCEVELSPITTPFHNVGNVRLAAQPNGRLGYWGADSRHILGLSGTWPKSSGNDYLFAGGPWTGVDLGNGDIRVMDTSYNESDWNQTMGTVAFIGTGIADEVIGVTYDDSTPADSPRQTSAGPIGLRVHQQSYAWGDAARDDFIIFTHDFTNTGVNGDLTGVFPALWMDPDISPNTDDSGFDTGRGMIYMYDLGDIGDYIGLMVLGEAPSSAMSFYGYVDDSTPEILPCEDAVHDTDKFERMLTAELPTICPGPWDTRMMTTAQPFDLAVGAHHTVAYGMVFGGNLAELQANADVMELIYVTEVATGEILTEIDEAGGINAGQLNALSGKLEKALDRLEQGKLKAGRKMLDAFVNQVNAFISSGKLTAEQGQQLIDVADGIINVYFPKAVVANPELESSSGFFGTSLQLVPEKFDLNQNYPNPFNPVTTIRFDVPVAARVKLVVYDMLGRPVRNLVDGVVSAGMHSADFDARMLPSGAYIYRLDTPNGTFSKTMLLLK